MVVRNDELRVEDIRQIAPAKIVISPGPGRPESAGCSEEIIRSFSGRIPILGVCLGHQCIGTVFGGRVIRAKEPCHGKTSRIHHDGEGLFKGLISPSVMTRYHSLIVEKESLPRELRATAFAESGEIMALVHREHPTFGVQFHPESIESTEGRGLIRNFLAID